MKYVVSLICFFLTIVINVGLASHSRDSVAIRSGYVDSLSHVVKTLKYNKTLSVALTEYSIPESSEEALLFFQLDYENGSTVEFRKLLQIIDSLCLKGRATTVKKFILLSQFVDGYFAEDYFDSAKKICKSQHDVFCEVFNSTNITMRQRLMDFGITCK